MFGMPADRRRDQDPRAKTRVVLWRKFVDWAKPAPTMVAVPSGVASANRHGSPQATSNG